MKGQCNFVVMATPQDHERLMRFARANGETLADVIRGWINEGLESEGLEALQEIPPSRNQKGWKDRCPAA